MSILDTIVKYKEQEVAAAQKVFPISLLQQAPLYNAEPVSLIKSLQNSKNGIIAEFKRKSPSKKEINLESTVTNIAKVYQDNQAAAMSVLTDTQFFGGSNQDLLVATQHFKNPILRKDFVVSTYQIHQAKAIGAHVILLIAAVLTQKQMQEFAQLAQQLKLEVLVEIHSEDELAKIPFGAHIVYGINNRNLKTFQVDFNNSIHLVHKLPQKSLKVAESGLTSVQDIQFLRKNGFNGFLIGELFMKMTPDQVHQFFKAVSYEN